jgi:hypothetical protein
MTPPADLMTLDEARATICFALRPLLQEVGVEQWPHQVDAFLAGHDKTLTLKYAIGDFFMFEATAELVKDADCSLTEDVYRWSIVSRVTIDGTTAESGATVGCFHVKGAA